ncbi:MAG: MFS transporter, partial [Gemmatimonadaceae bacterium]|nr:MFS transporter [Gemmatimonadaceae bacterium]
MNVAAPPARDAYASFRIPAFRAFIASLLAMTLALQIQGVVVAWQVYALTRDPLSLGLVGLAEALPFLAAALPAGQWADRHDRRAIATGSIAVLVVCAVVLLLLTATGALTPQAGGTAPRTLVWLVYAVLGVSGVARAVLQPARQALAAELVPVSLYTNAVTWRSTTWQGGSVA